MIPWQEKRLEKSNKWGLLASVHDFRGSTHWDWASILQWGGVGLVGLFLGIYSVVVWSLPSKWVMLSIPVILAPFVAMVFGQVRKFLLAVMLLDIPFQFDIYLNYNEQDAALGALSGWNVSLTTLALIILYTLWFADLLARPGDKPLRFPFQKSIPLILYLVINVLSLIVAQDIELSAFKIFLMVQMFLVYVYIVCTVQTREEVVFIVMLLFIGLILESLLMIGLWVIGHSLDFGVGIARIDNSSRVGGTVGSPNSAAGYLTLLLAPAMGMLLTSAKRYQKAIAAAAFGFGAIALFFTFSRGGWIALIISIMLLLLFTWYRGWISMRLSFLGAILGMILVFAFQDVFLARLFGDDDGSADSRIPLMMIAYRVIMDNPILGVGVNNYAVAMWQYAELEIAGFWIYIVHNKYLLVWAEIGTAGFFSFLWFLLATIRRGWQCWMFKDRLLSPIALGFAVAICAHMIHMNFDVFQFRGLIQMLWISAALIIVIHNIGSQTCCYPSLDNTYSLHQSKVRE